MRCRGIQESMNGYCLPGQCLLALRHYVCKRKQRFYVQNQIDIWPALYRIIHEHYCKLHESLLKPNLSYGSASSSLHSMGSCNFQEGLPQAAHVDMEGPAFSSSSCLLPVFKTPEWPGSQLGRQPMNWLALAATQESYHTRLEHFKCVGTGTIVRSQTPAASECRARTCPAEASGTSSVASAPDRDKIPLHKACRRLSLVASLLTPMQTTSSCKWCEVESLPCYLWQNNESGWHEPCDEKDSGPHDTYRCEKWTETAEKHSRGLVHGGKTN